MGQSLLQPEWRSEADSPWSTPWLLTIAGEGPVGVGAVIGGIVGIYVAWITDHTFVDILVALYSLPSEGALTLELVDLVRARGAVLTRIARAFVDIYLAIFAFEALDGRSGGTDDYVN